MDVRSLHKEYWMGPSRIKALNGVTFRIDRGEFVAIAGPSGSGKSTLMNILGCLDTPSAGSYFLAGDEASGLSTEQLAATRNRHIGFVFQSFNLLPRANALENVELPLVYRGMPARQRREAAGAVLDLVGLSDRLQHLPSELSGGQRQRVAIARALVGNPAVVLADEPTGALDTHTGEEIMRLFTSLQQRGVTLIMVTHDQDLANRAERVIRLLDGRIVSDSRRAE